jgi:hypothetical protein
MLKVDFSIANCRLLEMFHNQKAERISRNPTSVTERNKNEKAFLKQSKQLSNQSSKLIFMSCWCIPDDHPLRAEVEPTIDVNGDASFHRFPPSLSFDKLNGKQRSPPEIN